MQPSDLATSEMNTFKSVVTVLADPNAKDDIKLKAAQELIKNFETILNSPLYPLFLEHSVKLFLKILDEGEPYFISEYNIQQVRKLILEMLHRLPTNDLLKPYVKQMLSLMLKLLEIENEENVLVCLRIIIELHKQYRPTFNPEIQHFLQFVKSIYSELPNHLPKIFEPRPPIVVNELSEINLEELLQKTFTVTAIQTGKKTKDGTVISYNLIPKAVLSLKVLQELPIIVVLMYQLYKQNVPQDVADFIPLVMKTITLQPSLQQRQSPYFNKEVFVDFMGAQIKTLSFLAFIIKMYQEVVSQHSAQMVQGMLDLLTLCPMEVAHLRRELLIATRHILATELRIHFVPHMERLFDEDVLLGRGWTTHESLRPLAYSTLADLVHHVRQHLGLPDLVRAVHLFSKNVHDESLATNIQTVSCKLLLNLVDCIRLRSEQEGSPEGSSQGCELLMRMLEVFVLKFKTIAKIQLPILINQW